MNLYDVPRKSDGHVRFAAYCRAAAPGPSSRRRVLTAGASDQRIRYRLPDGRTLFAKSIRPVRLPDICAGCRFDHEGDCQEGFYGVRMYRARNGPFMVGVCIQRMDLCLTLGEFVMSKRCAEVRDFREEEAARLVALYEGAQTSA